MNKLTTLTKEQIEVLYPGLCNALGLTQDSNSRFLVLDGTEKVFYTENSSSLKVSVLSIPIIDEVPHVHGTRVDNVFASSKEEFTIEDRSELVGLGYDIVLKVDNVNSLYQVTPGARPSGALKVGFDIVGTHENWTVNGIAPTRSSRYSELWPEFEVSLDQLGMDMATALASLTKITLNNATFTYGENGRNPYDVPMTPGSYSYVTWEESPDPGVPYLDDYQNEALLAIRLPSGEGGELYVDVINMYLKHTTQKLHIVYMIQSF